LHALPNHLTESDHNWVSHFPLQKIIKNVKFSHLFQKLLLLLNLHYLNLNLLKKLLRKQSKRANHQLPNQLKKRNPHLLKIKRSLPKKWKRLKKNKLKNKIRKRFFQRKKLFKKRKPFKRRNLWRKLKKQLKRSL
jgi:hypothetical protein